MIYIFRTSDPAGASPNNINAFVNTAIATGSGEFSSTFPTIPAGQRLVVLQDTTADNGSELSEACEPVGEDC